MTVVIPDFLSTDEQPREMPIIDPKTGAVMRCKDNKPAYILVHSVNSAAGVGMNRDSFDRARAAREAGATELSFDELGELQRANSAKMIAGWRFIDPTTREEVAFPYSPEAARDLMASNSRQWLRKQIDAFAADDGNFMRA